MAAPLPHLFTFWSGPVSWFERLSATTALARGHTLTVYGYGTPDPVWRNLGVTVADARELWNFDSAHDRAMLRHKPSHYSDQLRFEGLAKRCGTWMDLDCMVIRPIPATDHLFAREAADPASYIGTSVLHLPADSPALDDLRRFFARRPFKPVPPHWNAPKRLGKTVEWYRDRLLNPGKVKTVLGPDALTGALVRHGLDRMTLPYHTFFPLPQMETLRALLPASLPAETVKPDTCMIHMWCKSVGFAGPLPGSWLGEVAASVGFPLIGLDGEVRSRLEAVRTQFGIAEVVS